MHPVHHRVHNHPMLKNTEGSGPPNATHGPHIGMQHFSDKSKAHPGFAAVEAKIARQPGIRNAGAVLAARTRTASKAAKKANPHLKRVKG